MRNQTYSDQNKEHMSSSTNQQAQPLPALHMPSHFTSLDADHKFHPGMPTFAYPNFLPKESFLDPSSNHQPNPFLPPNANQFDFAALSNNRLPKRKREFEADSPRESLGGLTVTHLKLDPVTLGILYRVVPGEKMEDFLEGRYKIKNSSIRNEDEARAVKKIKQALRAERKSRREKFRRIQVNSSLMKLAQEVGIDPQLHDTNSILSSSISYIEELKRKLSELESFVGTQRNRA